MLLWLVNLQRTFQTLKNPRTINAAAALIGTNRVIIVMYCVEFTWLSNQASNVKVSSCEFVFVLRYYNISLYALYSLHDSAKYV